jgi:nucleoside-triphosphatase THEP1
LPHFILFYVNGREKFHLVRGNLLEIAESRRYLKRAMPKRSVVNLLITGLPGVGKTTLLRRVVEKLNCPAYGFYTSELRESGDRVGFSLTTLSGEEGILSHRDLKSRYRVGKYGVDVRSFEELGVRELERGLATGSLLVIDEIGKMELFSERFRRVLLQAMDAPNPVLATVLYKSHPFCDRLKRRGDTELLKIDAGNRERLVDILVERLAGMIAAGGHP